MRSNHILLSAAFLLASLLRGHTATYELSTVTPPAPLREFRGVWIATVGNIDWPSKPGLPTDVQKSELISILDRAAKLKLNAVVLQVRPACDAFYASTIEPWSEYLTGKMGQAPKPFYDPLAFAIEEAHKRGLELHAWFNPYRALHKSHEGAVSKNHISKTHPELVRRCGQYLWLDPGEREVQDYSLSVVLDVVNRYDIDGIHFDDYFYPNPADSGANSDFPDQTSWKKSGTGNSINLEDWRRENVNSFIERVYHSIKALKPWVKFGISPPGIWRPGFPAQIRGFDAYARIYADSRKWFASGWLDYLSPQLYWRIEAREQSFPVLLNWWAAQNVKGRHLWPGLSAAYAVSQKWNPDEIPDQIGLIRSQSAASGFILYNATNLLNNSTLVRALDAQLDTNVALVPASPWLSGKIPARPKAVVTSSAKVWHLSWNPSGTNLLRWWLIQTKTGSDWTSEVFSADQLSTKVNGKPELIAVTAVDCFGNASAPRVLQLKNAAATEARTPSEK